MSSADRLSLALSKLDKEQAAIASWRPMDGNLRIVAPAGSGKTTVLTALVALLLEQALIDPQGVILKTFANKMAKVLVNRIGSLVHSTLIPSRIGTFHALAMRRLKRPGRYPPPAHGWKMAQCLDADGRTRNGEIPTSHILWRCATEFGKMPGTGAPSLRIASSAEEVAQYARFADLCRGRMVGSGEEYAAAVGQKIRPPPDFDEAWAMVREAKTALRAWDFTDALEVYAERLRGDPTFDQCELIAVDEAQDLNYLMMDVVRSLGNMRPGQLLQEYPPTKIIMIGDVSQSIMGFSGGSPEIFAEADKTFDMKTLYLVNNYRSVPDIVELGNAVTAGKSWKLGPDSKAVRIKGADDSTAALQTVYLPPSGDPFGPTVHETVAEEINYEIRTQGAKAGEFAILTRTNAKLAEYQAALASEDIPYVLVGTGSLFSEREIETFISWCMMAQHQSAGALDGCLRHPKRFLSGAVVADIKARRSTGLSLVKAIEEAGDVAGGKTQQNCYKLADDVSRLAKLPWDAVPDAVLELLLPASQKDAKLKAGDSPDEDRPGLFKAACNVFKRFGSAGDACDFIDRCAAMARMDRDDGVEGKDRVTLSTAHKYKGKEAKHVYIDASAGSFPSARSSPRELEEERRLFYVAVTRGMDSVRFVVEDQPSEFTVRYCEKLLRKAGWQGGKNGRK